ncbi:MAG: hypothetical protein QXH89_01545 [Candidatus Anstonellales archaeon]
MYVFRYLKEKFSKEFLGFAPVALVKGFLEVLLFLILLSPLLLLVYLTANDISSIGIALIIILVYSLVALLAYLYIYWLLTMIVYIKVAEPQLSLREIFNKILKYRIESNALMIVTFILISVIGSILSNIPPNIFSPMLGIAVTSPIFGVIFAIVMIVLVLLLYLPFVVLMVYMKFSYIETGQARKSITEGISRFINNIKTQLKAIGTMLILNLITWIISFLILIVLISFAFSIDLIFSVLAMDLYAITRLIYELPKLITVLVIYAILNIIVGFIYEFLKLNALLYYFKSSK